MNNSEVHSITHYFGVNKEDLIERINSALNVSSGRKDQTKFYCVTVSITTVTTENSGEIIRDA